MKVRNLFEMAVCLLVFTACGNDEDLTVKDTPETCVATIEVDIDEVTTRTSYNEALNFSWSAGDALSVAYFDGIGYVGKKFSMKGAPEGRIATFECADFPTGEKKVGIFYPYVEPNDDGYLTGFELNKLSTCDFEHIGNYDALYAVGVTVTDGVLPKVKLKHAVSFMHFEKGFRFVNGVSDMEKIGAFYLENESRSGIQYRDDDLSFYSGAIGFEADLSMTADGKLDEDIYIPFLVKEGGESLTPTFSVQFIRSGDKWKYIDWEPAAKILQPGMIYTVTSETVPAQPWPSE